MCVWAERPLRTSSSQWRCRGRLDGLSPFSLVEAGPAGVAAWFTVLGLRTSVAWARPPRALFEVRRIGWQAGRM